MSSKNLTVYIPAKLARKMEKLPEVNYSRIAQDAIKQYIESRLQTSIPSEVLVRLRREKGVGFANGRRYAIEKIIPKTNYAKFEQFFYNVKDIAHGEMDRFCEAEGYDPREISIKPYHEEAFLIVARWFFGKFPQEVSNEFVKGIVSVVRDTWKSLGEVEPT